MVIGGRAGVENVENPGCQGAGLALRWAVAWMVAEHQWPWVGRPEGWWASGAEPQGMGAIGDLGRGHQDGPYPLWLWMPGLRAGGGGCAVRGGVFGCRSGRWGGLLWVGIAGCL